MFRGFEIIWAYIDDQLIITKYNWSDNLEKLELTLQNIKVNEIKCNIKGHFLVKLIWNIYVSRRLGM